MPSRLVQIFQISTASKILIVALFWLVLVSSLHYALNFESSSRVTIRMGYMPVITNLAAPLLDFASRNSGGYRFEAIKFSSFSEMGESLRNRHIDAAFIIAPLAVVLHQQNAGVRIVYIGNRHESTLVYRKGLNIKSFSDLAGKNIAVPLRYSGHNLAVRSLAEQYGIGGSSLDVVEMNPPDMPSALATGALDAYFVGEPFAAKSVYSGESEVLYYVEQIWPKFICNLLIVSEDLIKSYPDRVKALVHGAVRSGIWARNNQWEAATIASQYWNQPPDLVLYAMNTPAHRINFDASVPIESEIKHLAEQMKRFNLISNTEIKGLVDDRWALGANKEGLTGIHSILDVPTGK